MNAAASQQLRARVATGKFHPVLDKLRSQADKTLNMEPVSVMQENHHAAKRGQARLHEPGALLVDGPEQARWPAYIRRDGEVNPEINQVQKRLFIKALGQESESAQILVFFVLSTWFADMLPLAPVLLLLDNGDGSAEAVVRCLQALCRRSLVLAEFSRDSCLQLPQGLSPTLFLDKRALSRHAVRLLARTSRPGAYLMRAGRPVGVACAKVIRCREADDFSELVRREPPAVPGRQ